MTMGRSLLLLATLICTGCAATLTEPELRKRALAMRGNTVGEVYYQGREGDYDYFRIQGMVGDRRYRILVPNSVVQQPQSLKSPERLVGPHQSDSWVP